MDLRLDSGHDIYLEGGDFVLIGEDPTDADDVREECRQQVLIALKMRLGEYDLDLSKGTPYMEARAGRYTTAALAARMRAVVEAVPLVQTVKDVDIVQTGRDVDISITGTPFKAVAVRT